MTDQDIELLFIAAAASGCRYVEDFVDEVGGSEKKTAEILNRLWDRGILEKGEEHLHDRGRKRVAFWLVGEFPAMGNNADFIVLD